MLRLRRQNRLSHFSNRLSHFSKRYKISPNWSIHYKNDPQGRKKMDHRPQSGIRFPLAAQRETASHSEPEFRDAFSACGPSGKSIPFQASIPGRIFRRTPQRETPSHSKGKFRDKLSATPSIRKARPTPFPSGDRIISLLGLPSIKRRPPGRRARSSSRVPHAKEAT